MEEAKRNAEQKNTGGGTEREPEKSEEEEEESVIENSQKISQPQSDRRRLC